MDETKKEEEETTAGSGIRQWTNGMLSSKITIDSLVPSVVRSFPFAPHYVRACAALRIPVVRQRKDGTG
ncbi:uncharacterized protein FOMMEDRAFT_169970 [Fomitiporia mediterranea MF3/22]|uniref:uncharacterized protein n=1 Tax=Fomitiporia mediterranea (strain MF3/22) TaxID=694068 RepID=UPI000440734B|nr:uncharacterized protein FOMMEDRAFT_169970 [Fomitiporia mediterranea MF3/22]EJD00577.1 hypothetical protein FOMMEDRAFT_169970 [Fomitiporia mediterranea MF3/22]